MINFNGLTKFASNYNVLTSKKQNNQLKSLNADQISFTAKSNAASHIIELTKSATQTFFPDYIELNLQLILGKMSLPNSLNQRVKELSDSKLVDLLIVKTTENDKKPIALENARKMDDHEKTYILKTHLKHYANIKYLKNYVTEEYAKSARSEALSTIENFSKGDKKQNALYKLANKQCYDGDGNESSLLNLLINHLSKTVSGAEELSIQDLQTVNLLQQKATILNGLLEKSSKENIKQFIDTLGFNDDIMGKINDMANGLARVYGSDHVPMFLNQYAKRVNDDYRGSKPIIDFIIDEFQLSKKQQERLERLNGFVNDPNSDRDKAQEALSHYKALLVKKHIRSNDDIKKMVGILTGSRNKILSPLIMSELKDLRKFKDKPYTKLNTVIDHQGTTVADYIIKRLLEENIITTANLDIQVEENLPDVKFTALAELLKKDKENNDIDVDTASKAGLNQPRSLIYRVVDFALEAISLGTANGTIS